VALHVEDGGLRRSQRVAFGGSRKSTLKKNRGRFRHHDHAGSDLTTKEIRRGGFAPTGTTRERDTAALRRRV
jgi:hypothetical protein